MIGRAMTLVHALQIKQMDFIKTTLMVTMSKAIVFLVIKSAKNVNLLLASAWNVMKDTIKKLFLVE